MKKIKQLWTQFFSRPDWMLRKEFFSFILCVPILYIVAMGVFASRSIHNLKAFETETIYLERLLQNTSTTRSIRPKNVDEAYVKNFLEKLSFLSEDRKQLSLLCSEVEDKDLYNGIKERLFFLQSGQNKLHFVSESKEGDTAWNTLHPVEMSCTDIKKLVTNVEGKAMGQFFPNPNRPNIFFSSLKITKLDKRSTDVFTVDMQILQKR